MMNAAPPKEKVARQDRPILVPTMEQILAPLGEDFKVMEKKEVLLRLFCLDLDNKIDAHEMAANWRALAFRAVEGSAALVEMLTQDADLLEDELSITRGEWDEPCRCCRREAYRYAPHDLPRSGQ